MAKIRITSRKRSGADNPTLGDSEASLHRWCMGLVEDCENDRQGLIAQWWQNLATYHGDLFVDWDPHKRRLVETKKSRRNVRLPINLAQPAVRTEYAKLLKNRPIVDCMARSNQEADLNAAEVGDKILFPWGEKHFHKARVRRSSLMWMLIGGTAGVLVDWDDMAQQPMEVMVDAKGEPIFDPQTIEAFRQYYKKQKKAPRTKRIPMGDLSIKPISPFMLMYDLSEIEFYDARWCIIQDIYDVTEIKRRWDEDVDGEEDVRPGVIEQRLLSQFDLTGRLTMNNPSTQKMAKVYRMFITPQHYYFPQGAELVFTREGMLEAKPLPFGHSELPVSVMGHIPQPTTQFSDSILTSIRGPILEISRTESQLLENRNLMSNPPWVIAEQHGVDDKYLVNKPGLKLKYRHAPNVPPPTPVKMPEMPSYVGNLVPMLKEHVGEIAGQGETSQGRVPPGARTGVAISYLQEEDDTKLGPTVQEYEEMIERMSWHELRVIAEKYDTPRTIQIYQPHSEPEVFDFIGNMLEGVAGVTCQAGSALPRSKAAKQQYILDLYQMGLVKDPREVRDMLELGQGEPDEWQVDLDQAKRENFFMKQGQQQPVEKWYNHAAHHFIHRREMKSAQFASYPPQVQQALREHDALHSEMEQEIQQDQLKTMASQAAAGAPNPEPTMGGGDQSGGGEAPGPGQNQPQPPAPFAVNNGGPEQQNYGPQ